MNNRRRNNLHIVRSDAEELQESRKRRRRWLAVIIIALICVALIAAYNLLMRNISYTEFSVSEEFDRTDTSATHYLDFGEGYVKYSNDGASYITFSDNTIWNQGYEMENPIAAVCGSYIAFADKQGETVYVLNESGIQGEISVNMPILRIDVASQGTVAILTTERGTGYLSLFDKNGEQIAEGAIHVENTGTLMDIALSRNGENLAAVILDVTNGTARTTINFYNFSTAGQNQIDNLVESLQYPDTIIPEITYTGNSTLLAFADNGVYVFDGASSPSESHRVETEDEIQSIFYDDSYLGLIYNTVSQNAGHAIYVYDTDGREQTVINTDFSYDNAVFLDNHEICLFSSDRCDIYTLSGSLKFSYEMANGLAAVFHARGYREYVLLEEDTTQRIRLKIFASLFGDRDGETIEAEYVEVAQ